MINIRPLSVEEMTLKCKEHNFECRGWENMRTHMRTHKRVPLSEMNVFQCTQCFYRTIYNYNLAQHMKSNHEFESAPMHKGSARKHGFTTGGGKPFRCNHCKYASRCHTNLKIHMFFRHFPSFVSTGCPKNNLPTCC